MELKHATTRNARRGMGAQGGRMPGILAMETVAQLQTNREVHGARGMGVMAYWEYH
eukprot:CAMPEP_0117050006 /NCGR_PEP_ID=MMETSP0472-20121206/34524_1 /TAXON_ID=693140 ORGANISM="Tiarina fusus, Strain LIS" /NCGR_SAMPLE_ID=MMETSP0472 /ASSEMBLY_ACC=CAM_ASM_000603 /LENGTH=55 /DNA_ID=CAMNT_0004763619 /DNA_START=25 /DNA_END=192 /DNA_ORIENTATION=-